MTPDIPCPTPAAAAPAELFTDPRITAFGLFSEAFAGVAGKLGKQLAQHGVAPAEFDVLLRLSRSPGRSLRLNDLASQTSLTTSGITRLVDRLERSGLVRRTACASDRRGMFAELTDAGLQRVTEMLPDHLELIDRWLLGPLAPAEREAMQSALRKVRDVVRPEATAGS